MQCRLLLLASSLHFCLGARYRRSQQPFQNPFKPPPNANPECEKLGDLVIDGHEIGKMAVVVCQFWPEGDFPLDDAVKLKNVLDVLMGPGGVWELLKTFKDDGSLSPFCWRDNQMRTVMTSLIASQDNSTQGCSMRSDGVCYGTCPAGFKPSALVGRFAPVCNSACGETAHPIGCGFGCAKTKGACARALLDQVSEVASLVGQVSGLLGGSAAVIQVVNEVVALAEFVFGVLTQAVSASKTLLKGMVGLSEKDFTAATILLVFQGVQGLTGVGMDLHELLDRMEMIIGMIKDLSDAALSGKKNTAMIANIFAKHGIDVMRSAVEVFKVFKNPTCQHTPSDVAFSVEVAGDDRVIGPWKQVGTYNGRPAYRLKSNERTRLEYRTDMKGWAFYADASLLFKKYLYVHKEANRRDYPVDAWVGVEGSDPMPEIIAVKPPMA